jgi:hypothetical protein
MLTPEVSPTKKYVKLTPDKNNKYKNSPIASKVLSPKESYLVLSETKTQFRLGNIYRTLV